LGSGTPGFADHRGPTGDNLYPEPWLGPDFAYNIFTNAFKRNLDTFPDLSIFTKNCPRCAAENAADSTRCPCGYVFDGSNKTDSLEAIEVALQEAELYADYLKARLHQTREAADVAAEDLKRNPDDANTQRLAEETRREYRITRTEYKLQLEQISTLKAEVETRQKEDAAAAAQRDAWELARKKAEARAIETKKREAAKAKAEAEAQKARAIETKKREAAKAKAEAEAQKARAIETKKREAAKATDPARPRSSMREKLARKAQKLFQRGRAATSEVAREPTPVPSTPRPVAKDQSSTRPAAKVQSAAASRPAANKPAAPKPVHTTKPSPRFREKQAAKAKVANPRPNTMECPHCTKVLPIGTETCRCGYSFSRTRESMPGIGLTNEEQARILDLFRQEK
jgi:hypothetical protein